MPARKGAASVAIVLPENLIGQLSLLAKDDERFHGNKSEVIEAAFRAFLDGRSNLTALDSVHEHLSRLTLETTNTLHPMQEDTKRLIAQVQGLSERLTTMGTQLHEMKREFQRELASVTRAYDSLRATLQESPKRGLFSRLNGS